MPNFEAKIRVGYEDIEGLLLDCRHGGLELDGSLWTNSAPPSRSVSTGSHTGANAAAALTDSAQFWRDDELVGKTVYNETDGSAGVITGNTDDTVTATLAGGVGNDWDTGDTYTIGTPRFGNPYQDVSANRPTVSTVGGIRHADFDRATQQFFKIPLELDILGREWWAVFDFEQGADATNDQTVLGFPQLEIFRRTAAGVFGYRHNAATVSGGVDMSTGLWSLHWTAAATAEMDLDGASQLAGAASDVAIDAADPAGYIGSADGASDWLDGKLASMQIWGRRPSPQELDFAYVTIDPDSVDHSTNPHATMLRRDWTDDTGATAQEVVRINPTRHAAQNFWVAQFAAGTIKRVQIAASVNGVVVPDTELGGDLFDMVCIEHPAGGSPMVIRDAGWSAIFDVRIRTEGHYTFAVYRTDGGTHILHLDAEEV